MYWVSCSSLLGNVFLDSDLFLLAAVESIWSKNVYLRAELLGILFNIGARFLCKTSNLFRMKGEILCKCTNSLKFTDYLFSDSDGTYSFDRCAELKKWIAFTKIPSKSDAVTGAAEVGKCNNLEMSRAFCPKTIILSFTRSIRISYVYFWWGVFEMSASF